ncbi:MAG: NAD(P)H-hydrate dehydratase [Candidatus Omnitrophica bacterium]|nr:NAD(P)H-hydrate dehydratase [Candidatus Omnitrophota bacterium]
MQLLKRKPDSHKGDYGHVLVVGGSRGLSGAVCLAAQAALRAGCGLVTAGVPNSLNEVFEIKLTEAMSLPLADREGSFSQPALAQIKAVLGKFDFIVLGPGAGTKPGVKSFILKLLKCIDKPVLLDADGINALSGQADILKKRKCRELILTPHLGEFSRLINKSIATIKNGRKDLVKKFALRYNLILVLKGRNTLVSDGRRLFENTTGNPGLATAGTGDVLSGIISGLAAQGLDAYIAAKTGVYLHGLASDIAAKDKTQNCLIASDVIDYLPKAIKSSL